jgi:hypothetical protein
MKANDFILRVLQEAKVDLTKLGLTTITPETELPEEAITNYEQNLLSRDRAIADPDINKVMQARAFKALNDGYDRDFEAFAESNMPKEVAEKVKTEKFTRNKWDIIRQNLKVTSDEGGKAARAEIEKLNQALREREAAITATKAEYEGKLTEFQKSFLLNQEFSKLELAEAYAKPLVRDSIFNGMVGELSKKGIIFTLDNGQLSPKRKSETGELLDVYEANEKVGLDSLLKKELKDYLKQSQGGGGNQQQQGGRQTQGAAPQPKSGMTLAELNALAVKEKFNKIKTN